MKHLFVVIAGLLWCKFFNWKSCATCGSLKTGVVVSKKLDWGYNYDFSPIRGLCDVRHKVKKCSCCGDEFVQQIAVRMASQRQLNKYIEQEVSTFCKKMSSMSKQELCS